jgi:hypothetical protein
MKTFNAGDVVRLKAVELDVTVESVCLVDEKLRVFCIWFVQRPDGSWRGPRRAHFSPESLCTR